MQPAVYLQARKLACKNVSGEEIPGESVVLITGVDADSGAWTVTKPDADGLSPALLAFSSATPIPAGKFGACTQDWPAPARFTGGTPDADPDVSWGTAAGSFLLTKGKQGFLGQGVEGEWGRFAPAGGGGAGVEFVRVVDETPTVLAVYDGAAQILDGAALTKIDGDSVWVWPLNP